MYIDLVVLLILLILVVFYFNKFHSYVLFIGIVDIALRILAFIKDNIPIKDVSNMISDYLPGSIIDLINKYTSDWEVVNLILRWAFVGIMIIFLYYVTKIFIKKKRI
ncbi:MAG: hypothetical protein IKE63_00935 [Bacilli bacterium]|nr:hypothetical protein [Bacilli bacterium]